MVNAIRPPANAFIAKTRKLYNPIGFSRGYNFVLFFIFAGALMGFTLARLPYLNFYRVYCRNDRLGECYYDQLGLIIHLAGILPAAFLACFQFVPVIRHKLLLLHRINGYCILLLSLVGVAGGIMAAKHAFGGELSTRLIAGVLAIMFVVSMIMAYANIKRLQIEQHRAWMLRGWFYAASIITMRLIMFIMVNIISTSEVFYGSRQCGQIDYIIGRNRTLAQYPDCQAFYSGEDPSKYVQVLANLRASAATAAAAFGVSFGPSAWLALVLHAVGIEIYLHLTPREHERLRNVSYQKQLEAGMRNPGSAGFTADRLGDAEPWVPAEVKQSGCENTQPGASL